MKKFKLMVARFPGNNQEHPASSQYVINLMFSLLQDDRISDIDNWYKSDTPITMVRNLCVKEALDRGIDYILMIDSDFRPDSVPGTPGFWPTAWEFAMQCRLREEIATDHRLGESALTPDQLFRAHPPITIAAPYCGPPPREECYIMQWHSNQTDDVTLNTWLAPMDRDCAADRRGIEEVAALPTGLILYDIRVFQNLTPPWFEYEWEDRLFNTRKASTEDIYQTRNASMQGMPQFVAWDCWADHIKQKFVPKPRPFTLMTLRQEFAKGVLRGAGLSVSDPIKKEG